MAQWKVKVFHRTLRCLVNNHGVMSVLCKKVQTSSAFGRVQQRAIIAFRDVAVGDKRELLRKGVLIIAYLGISHFSYGIWLTIRLLAGSLSATHLLAFVCPYVGVFLLFIVGVFFGHRKQKLRLAIVVVGIALAASVAACAYDLSHKRCQINGGGSGHGYTMWWWYYEPYWEGSTPGTL
jgi:hypothetical protein